MIIWPWDDFVRPIRSYFARRRRSRWKQQWDRSTCPSCNLPFDKGRKRCVVDSCGHHRCYACLCAQEVCPTCPREKPNENLCAYKRARISTHSANETTNYQSLDVYCEDKNLKRFSMISNLSHEGSYNDTVLNTFESTITLKPLYFEVPQSEGDNSFLYRDWIFKEISKVLATDARGVILVGDAGSGKTFLNLQLVDRSSFGRKQKSTNQNGSLKRSVDTLEILASQVLGYHFCQVDCIETCRIPDFIHSLAAQLCQAPQLTEYRNLLIQDESYQDLLSLDSCIENPDKAFEKGILEPLGSLSKYQMFTGLLVIDSIQEAESQSSSLAAFLAKYVSKFPFWLKIVMSVSIEDVHIISALNLHSISLKSSERQVQEDLLHYIQCRIRRFPAIQTNISAAGDEKQISRFAEHLITGGHSSFLYSKLILDLLQQNHLVVKSSTFNVIPVSLDEVFTLIFNLRFPSAATFSKIRAILEICLASQSPLTAVEVFYALESASVEPTFAWHGFTKSLHTLSGILIQRNDASLMLFHPALRRWLSRNKKFLCDRSSGHTYLALLPSRLKQPLTPEKTLEFLSHLSRCNLFDKEERLKALWMQQVITMPSSIIVNPRILFQPDIQIIHLLLESGADSNSILNNLYKHPVINLSCKLGYTEAVELMLRFGADKNKTDTLGTTPLMEAAREGHLKIIEILLDAGAKIYQQDRLGRCALSIGAERGHLSVVEFLIKRKSWPTNVVHSQAIQRALIAASGAGNFQMCQNLLQLSNCPEKTLQEFKTACTRGQEAVCELFLKNDVSTHNLHLAASRGHLSLLRILSSKGVNMDAKDVSGRTAVSWACIYRQYEVIQFLLEAGVDSMCKDCDSNYLLHLAAMYGNAKLINMLRNYGVRSDLRNNENKTPLECAITAKNMSSTRALLQGGVDINSKAFECAQNQRKLYILLLNKLMNDGITLYKTGQIVEASSRFEYALTQASRGGNYTDISSRLREGLARCQRRIDGKEKVEDKF